MNSTAKFRWLWSCNNVIFDVRARSKIVSKNRKPSSDMVNKFNENESNFLDFLCSDPISDYFWFLIPIFQIEWNSMFSSLNQLSNFMWMLNRFSDVFVWSSVERRIDSRNRIEMFEIKINKTTKDTKSTVKLSHSSDGQSREIVTRLFFVSLFLKLINGFHSTWFHEKLHEKYHFGPFRIEKCGKASQNLRTTQQVTMERIRSWNAFSIFMFYCINRYTHNLHKKNSPPTDNSQLTGTKEGMESNLSQPLPCTRNFNNHKFSTHCTHSHTHFIP